MTIVLPLASNRGSEEACLLCAADTSGYVHTQGRSYASWVPQARLFPEGILWAQLPFWHSLTFSTAAGVACPHNVGHMPGSTPQGTQKLSAAEQGEEAHSYDQTWGWNPIASPPGFLCMQHFWVDTSVSNLHPLLGVMASLPVIMFLGQ